jgi:uncharacterized repeat protein (TIGR03803 family)
VLYSFCSESSCADGSNPNSALISDAAGNFYGVTSFGGLDACGGTFGCGTVFQLIPGGNGTWSEAVLHNFGNGTDGYYPLGAPIFDTAGNLYGTTEMGGAFDGGIVFQLAPAGGGSWTESVMYSFGSGTDGLYPFAGLIFDASGNLYGTTYGGGTNSSGTVFEITP